MSVFTSTSSRRPRLASDVARQRYLRIIVFLTIVEAVIGLFVQFILAQEQSTSPSTIGLIFTGGFIALALVALVLIQRDRLTAATNLLVIMFLAGMNSESTQFFVLGALALVTASVVRRRWVFLFAGGLVVISGVGQIARVLAANPSVATPEFSAVFGGLSGLIAIGVAIRYYIETAEDTSRSLRRTTSLLQATAEVGQIIGKVLEMDALLARAVELIRDRFAYYHVQVFLVDEARDYARLVASTGDVGRKLMEREHKLLVGSQSVIGRVTQIGEPVIARDTDTASVHYHNELLPNTRSELALPIIDGDTVVGALDVQSARADAFTDADIQALQVVSNQLATAIRNAQLFAAQAESVNESKRLFLESEASLREIRRLNRQLTKSAWDEFLASHRDITGITLENTRMLTGADWTDKMDQASQRRRAVVVQQNDLQTVTVPIVLRGEVLGAIEVETGTDFREQETAEMVQAVAQRLAISLDNARLFEEAQIATAYEQNINEIVSRYQGAGTIDDLLHITLEELSQTLGAKRGAIRLGQTQHQPANGNGNGGAAR